MRENSSSLGWAKAFAAGDADAPRRRPPVDALRRRRAGALATSASGALGSAAGVAVVASPSADDALLRLRRLRGAGDGCSPSASDGGGALGSAAGAVVVASAVADDALLRLRRLRGAGAGSPASASNGGLSSTAGAVVVASAVADDALLRLRRLRGSGRWLPGLCLRRWALFDGGRCGGSLRACCRYRATAAPTPSTPRGRRRLLDLRRRCLRRGRAAVRRRGGVRGGRGRGSAPGASPASPGGLGW